jgi:tetratricopeptide (TPR) repeat protein
MDIFKKDHLEEFGKAYRDFAFFTLFCLYLWLYVDLHLIYHGAGKIRYFPVFYKGWFFFKEYLPYPGGLVEYVSAFLSQFFYFSWAGALIITLQAWVVSAFVNSFIESANASHLKWLRFVPPIFFLVLYSQYTFYFTTTMTLTVAFCFIWLYMKFNFKNKSLRLLVFFVLSTILYALVGGAYIVFALLCGMYELLSKRQWRTSLIFLLSALIIPYIEGVFIYGFSNVDAFTRLTPIFWKFQIYNKTNGVMFVYGIYLFLPLIGFALIIWRIFNIRFVLPKFISRVSKISFMRNKNIRWFIDTSFLFLVAAISVCFSFHSNQKVFFAVDYYAYNRMWPQVLKAARDMPKHDIVIAAVDRALYHSGQLGNTAFTLHQNPGTLLLVGKNQKDLYWYQFDIFLDLGYVNRAEHDLAEALEFYGERPQLLQRMALINMVKGNLGTARIYLGTLNKMLFYSEWASEYLNRIESDPTLSMDKRVQYLRSLMIDREHLLDYPTVNALLLELLEKNRHNRMAFEYLMTCYLLTNDLNNFAKNIDRFEEFKYHHIPRLFEEAILIIGSDPNGRVLLQSKKLNISTKTFQRFNSFLKVLSTFKGDRNKAFREFPNDFRNSYFFYYTFFKNIYSGEEK